MCGFITGVFGACTLPGPVCLLVHLAGAPLSPSFAAPGPGDFLTVCLSPASLGQGPAFPAIPPSLDVFLGPPLSQSLAIRTPTSSTATASESPEIQVLHPEVNPPHFWVSNVRRLTTRTFQLSVFLVRGWRQNLTDLPLVAVGPRASFLTSLTLGFLIVEGIDTHRVAAWIERDKAEAAPAPLGSLRSLSTTGLHTCLSVSHSPPPAPLQSTLQLRGLGGRLGATLGKKSLCTLRTCDPSGLLGLIRDNPGELR